MNTGIYCIRNLMDGKEYIGSSAHSFRKRWNRHLSDLRHGRYHSHLLQKAWNACGESAFEFSVIESCPPDKCVEREQYFLDTLDPVYNVCRFAGSWLGRKHTTEARAKTSAGLTGKHPSPETRAKISASLMGHQRNLGRHPSIEARAKMSKSHRGHKASPETCAKRSVSFMGHDVSPEARAKMRVAWVLRKLNLTPVTSIT